MFIASTSFNALLTRGWGLEVCMNADDPALLFVCIFAWLYLVFAGRTYSADYSTKHAFACSELPSSSN